MKIRSKTSARGLESLIKSLKKLEKLEIAGGILKGKRVHPKAEMNYAALLAMHELSDGSHYPQRPVLKIAAQENALKWSMKAGNLLGKMLATKKNKVITYPEVIKTLKPVADMMKKDIKRSFYSSKLKSNAPSTVRQKGFNRPMQETGKLRDHIKAKVRKRK